MPAIIPTIFCKAGYFWRKIWISLWKVHVSKILVDEFRSRNFCHKFWKSCQKLTYWLFLCTGWGSCLWSCPQLKVVWLTIFAQVKKGSKCDCSIKIYDCFIRVFWCKLMWKLVLIDWIYPGNLKTPYGSSHVIAMLKLYSL